MLLARLGRPEAINCINGLNQYGFAYEGEKDSWAHVSSRLNASFFAEAWDHAREIGQILNANTPPSNSQGSAPRPSSDGDSDMEHYPGDSNVCFLAPLLCFRSLNDICGASTARSSIRLFVRATITQRWRSLRAIANTTTTRTAAHFVLSFRTLVRCISRCICSYRAVVIVLPLSFILVV
jgi:hypothetical protein